MPGTGIFLKGWTKPGGPGQGFFFKGSERGVPLIPRTQGYPPRGTGGSGGPTFWGQSRGNCLPPPHLLTCLYRDLSAGLVGIRPVGVSVSNRGPSPQIFIGPWTPLLGRPPGHTNGSRCCLTETLICPRPSPVSLADPPAQRPASHSAWGCEFAGAKMPCQKYTRAGLNLFHTATPGQRVLLARFSHFFYPPFEEVVHSHAGLQGMGFPSNIRLERHQKLKNIKNLFGFF